MFRKLPIALITFLLPVSIFAIQWNKTYAFDAYVGPEIYYVYRTKEGGTKQSGPLYGIRLGYDYVKRYKFYWGCDFLWAQGPLEGKTKKNEIKSIFTDANVEGRFGYTFQSKRWRCLSFTPFVGYGYFWENNFFQHPSPLPIHFRNHFTYIPFGFLSQIFITPTWSAGVNLKIRYILNSSVNASHDPEHSDSTQQYDEQMQYRIEIPLTYYHCWFMRSFAFSLVPFYECRPYGHRPNYPFDFLETTIQLYGATLKLSLLF